MTKFEVRPAPARRSLILGAGVLALACALAWTPTFESTGFAGVDDGPMHDGMESLNRSFRSLRRAKGDLAKITEGAVGMQKAIALCKGETPDTVAALEGDARAAALKEYRIQMIELMKESLNLERAALEDDAENVQATIRTLQGMQKKGHDQFKKDED